MLNSGTKLGPYEITGNLGAGGMGEVYRARDTRLERVVAIKILPKHLSERADARERFDREARSISSLNHPNICQLYDVGQQDGISFLVMEFLEGETLADRLKKGPLPLPQALKCAIEISDGLERAHRTGVVHRDLKPGNIMLTKSGAKLMDFGLAKPVVPGNPPSSGLTQTLVSETLVTQNHPLTAEGTVVGTFQYMSPEQVEGKEADARSDIFALGTVIYETVTGKRAFDGKTTASTIAAILAAEPPPISSVTPMSPPALESVVKSCLAKDPDERIQTAHDVKLQLKHISESGSQAGVLLPAVSHRKEGASLAWILTGLLALTTLVAGIAAYLANQKHPPVLRVQVTAPDKTQFNLAGDSSGPAVISPDGTRIVFSANDGAHTQLYVRALDSLTAQALPGTDGAIFPFWSPDNRSVGFFTTDKLKRIDVSGGNPVTICDSVLGRGGSWGPDGTILAAISYNTGISQVSASGGTPTLITQVDNVKYTSHRWPYFLPDGKHFLYNAVNHNVATSADSGVYFASLDGKENRLLFHTLSSAIFASGYLLYLRENSLVAQPFDPSTGKLTGEASPLSENPQFDGGLWRTNVSASNNGLLIYASTASTGTQILTWYDRSGKQLGTLGDRGGFFDLEFSPDATKVAVTDANTATATVWITDIATKLRTRLTFTGGAHRTPIWSPDGKQIAFTSDQQRSIAVKPIGGGVPDKILLSSPDPIYAGVSDWSRDGRFLLYDQGNPNNGDIWVLPMTGESKPFPYLSSPANELNGKFSPDGRWVAFQSGETGRPEIFVAPFPWTGAKWQVSNGGGLEARWRGDGKELFYFNLNEIVAVEVDGSGSTFKVGATKPLFRAGLNTVSREYVPTHDGQRFLLIAPSESTSQPLTLVQDWTAQIRK